MLVSAGLWAGSLAGLLLKMLLRIQTDEKQLLSILAGQTGGLFAAWSATFIYRSSFVTVTNERFFALFDDAMISMRYGWNLANGNGLVWSAGERVEGYTNFLMTLYMAFISWLIPEQRYAVLVLQITGVVTVLVIAVLALLTMRHVIRHLSPPLRVILPLLAFAGVCAYYPLVFWSLMGMETGLWTLWILASVLWIIRYRADSGTTGLLLPGVLLGLAQLTRPETPVIAGVLAAYLFLRVYQQTADTRLALRRMVLLLALFGVFFGGQLLFRLAYYGEFVPNTYDLKATGWPLFERIQAGIRFLTPFVRDTFWLIVPGTLVAFLTLRRDLLLFVILFALFFAEQIYVGGDAWPYWRMTAPFIPLLFIAFIAGLTRLLLALAEHSLMPDLTTPAQQTTSVVLVLLFVTGLGFWHSNFRFFEEYTFQQAPYNTEARQQQVNTALALKAVLTPDATIAVTWGGLPLYYSQIQHGVDMLGKSDPVIANLDDVWHQRPGHNKYDLRYSIVEREPDYIPTCAIGEMNLCYQLQDKYVRVAYRGIELLLRRDSPHVNWSEVQKLE
jgi:hypothetical protein